MFASARLSPERVAAIAVGIGAGATSSLLVAFMPLSIFGRAFVFLGSGVIGGLLSGWAGLAKTTAGAFGRANHANPR